MVCTYGFHRFQESYSVKAESCEAHVKHHGWAHAAGYAHVQSVLRFFRQSINRQIFMYSIASPHAKPITRHLVFIINYVSQHVKSITAIGIHHKLCLVKRLEIQQYPDIWYNVYIIRRYHFNQILYLHPFYLVNKVCNFSWYMSLHV